MKNNIRIPHTATLLLLLTLVLLLLSWLFDVYGLHIQQAATGEQIRVQSLLRPEGIRWLLRNAISNFTSFQPLGNGIILLFGIGIGLHSGFIQACIPVHKKLSRKEKRALLTSLTIGFLYVLVVLWATFSNHGILLSAMGTLNHSPLIAGSVVLIALGIGTMGIAYGFSSGRYRKDVDVISGMMFPLPLMGHYLVITFFTSQLFACLSYSRLDEIIYIPNILLYSPLLLAIWEYYRERGLKKAS